MAELHRSTGWGKKAATYQLCAMDLHCLLRELVGHGQQVSRNFDGVLECHAIIVGDTADKALANT
jgi:hypothetical protein